MGVVCNAPRWAQRWLCYGCVIVVEYPQFGLHVAAQCMSNGWCRRLTGLPNERDSGDCILAFRRGIRAVISASNVAVSLSDAIQYVSRGLAQLALFSGVDFKLHLTLLQFWKTHSSSMFTDDASQKNKTQVRTVQHTPT